MDIHIITIFPRIFDSYLSESIIGRAIRNKKIRVITHDLRSFTKDKHRRVDDRPYGGGPGMVLQVEPIVRALEKIVPRRTKSTRVILTSTKGKLFSQQHARKFATYKTLVVICGHYEGVDERVKSFVDEEISIGQYVLTGGELAAAVILDSVTRLLPGVLGDAQSHVDESHEKRGVLEYPQYTRPEIFRKKRVPKVLLSGNHEGIAKWRDSKRKHL